MLLCKLVKERVRKGIPDPLRGNAWQLFAETEKYKTSAIGLFDKLCSTDGINKNTEDVILKDINRTFPNHSHFKDKYGQGLFTNEGKGVYLTCFTPTQYLILK